MDKKERIFVGALVTMLFMSSKAVYSFANNSKQKEDIRTDNLAIRIALQDFPTLNEFEKYFSDFTDNETAVSISGEKF